MSTQGSDALLSPSDIADIVGVNRPVVSNWRKRHADFPSAVAGTEAKPLFTRGDVLVWLRRRGHKVEEGDAGDRLWSALNAIRDQAPLDDAADFVLLLATLKRVKPGMFDGVAREHPAEQSGKLIEATSALRSTPGLQDLPAPPPAVLRLQPSFSLVIDAVARIDDRELARSVDFVLERLSRWQIKSGAEHGFVGSRTSALLASLASGSTGIVYDPACGIANVLVQIAERGSALQLVGSDINLDALLVGAQRALLHGVCIDLLGGDVLARDPHPDLRADVVVVEPPFGMAWDVSSAMTDPRFAFGVPPRMASDLAWVQHAVAHLAPDGRAYVLTYPGALFRAGSERQIRANLLTAGCVEAVVALPTKMLPHTSIGPALWVLRPRTEPGEVLLVDASREDVDQVGDKVAAWFRRDPAMRAEPDVPHAVVPVVDLLASDAALTPAKWIGEASVDKETITASFARASAAAAQTLRLLGDSSLALGQLAGLPESRTATVRELIESGVVELRLGRPDKARDLDPNTEARIVRASDIRDRNLPGTDDLVDFGDTDLTERGDVLVTTMNEVRAIVDETGGHLGSTGVDRIRILDLAVITPSYLAAALTGSWNSRLQAGTTVQRAPIRDLEVPLIPPRDQTKVVQALDTIRAVRDLSRQLDGQSRDTQGAILDALRYNVPLDPPMSEEQTQRAGRRRGHDAPRNFEGA